MECSLKEQIASTDMDSENYGCSHYRRRCKIRAPCCDEIFDCRHCHNESKNSLDVDPLKRHDIPRHDIKRVICSVCNTEQDVQQNCIQCGVCMGEYFCSKCNLFDDDVSKNQYHCDKCEICRTGGEENFFHCDTCVVLFYTFGVSDVSAAIFLERSTIITFSVVFSLLVMNILSLRGCCYTNVMKESHNCIEGAMHHNCPVCFEYIFDTTKDISMLPCGHTIHVECLMQMRQHLQYSCPVCSKSYCDMSRVWELLDQEVASTAMPKIYQNKMVWILCNDCTVTSEVNFHVVAHKCPSCKSYNTKQTRGGTSSYSNVTEMVR